MPPLVDDIQGRALIFYFPRRKIKKPPPIWKRKQLYHPFTYPPICAQDYGRAPSLITTASQARLGSDIHTAHTPYRASTVSDSLYLFRAATVFVTVFRFFTYRFYYKYFEKSRDFKIKRASTWGTCSL